MDYTVPPKQVVVYKGRTYGAGDTVPGYAPPAEVKAPIGIYKPGSKKSHKTRTPEPVDDVIEAAVEDTDNLLTGEDNNG